MGIYVPILECTQAVEGGELHLKPSIGAFLDDIWSRINPVYEPLIRVVTGYTRT